MYEIPDGNRMGGWAGFMALVVMVEVSRTVACLITLYIVPFELVMLMEAFSEGLLCGRRFGKQAAKQCMWVLSSGEVLFPKSKYLEVQQHVSKGGSRHPRSYAARAA